MSDDLNAQIRRLMQQFKALLDHNPGAQDPLKHAYLLGCAVGILQAKQDDEPTLTVGVQCPNCRTHIIVLPAKLYKAIGDLQGAEGELQFLEHIKTDKAKTGHRLAIADVDGRYTCPECDHPGQLPPEDELRHLA